jgi:serine/threonine protein kinase/ketosteroid isomerase-like protein
VASIPEKIGTFEVIRQIGSGGMGAVYLGRDPELDRQVAIKVIREEVHEQEVLDRFFREARAAAALRHANIITVFASGQQDHKPYIAMEYIEGESFADIIKQRRNLPLAEKISYLEQLCAGLAFAHKAGIVHRDVKPANIMIDREGVVRILDFGIARIEGSAMTQDGTMMGSLNYMSPEQMLGKPVDQRSDIFSVGSVAYELLCYQQAFKGNLNDGLLHRLPHEDPPLLKEIYPALPLAIEQVVMRALEKDPGRRYQNLTDMRTALVNAHAAGKQLATVPQVQPVEDERTVVVARPKTNPPAAVAVPPPAPTPAPPGYGGSPSPKTAKPPAGPDLSEIREPHSQMAYIPPPAGLKLKSEATPPAPPMVEKPTPPPPRSAPPPPANIAVAPSPPSTRRTATVAGPPRPQASSKKGMLIGVAVVVVAIGAAAAAYLSGQFNPPPQDPLTVARPQIEAAMAEYRSAYRNRDLEGVVEVFPELPAATRQAMQQAFENCLIYEVVFADMQVALDAADPNSAQVEVRSTHNCTPTSGGRQTDTSHHDVFALKKIGDEWLITGSAPVSAGGPQ